MRCGTENKRCINSTERVKDFIDFFIRSEEVQAYHESAISSDYEIGGRFERCMDAAENGSNGSTHKEVIDDWRGAFAEWIRQRRRSKFSADPDRFIAAVEAHFDEVETWHANNGSLYQEIG